MGGGYFPPLKQILPVEFNIGGRGRPQPRSLIWIYANGEISVKKCFWFRMQNWLVDLLF